MPIDFIGRAHDFDFLVGRWRVANRRLRKRHAGCTDWDEFEATSEAWSHLGGLVSVDEMVFPARGFGGCSIRSLDVAARRWAIHWVNSGDGRLAPPVHGGWHGDVGEFLGEDEDDGRRVRVRFAWQRLGDGRARWSQDFALVTDDSAGPWETNWVMEMERLAS